MGRLRARRCLRQRPSCRSSRPRRRTRSRNDRRRHRRRNHWWCGGAVPARRSVRSSAQRHSATGASDYAGHDRPAPRRRLDSGASAVSLLRGALSSIGAPASARALPFGFISGHVARVAADDLCPCRLGNPRSCRGTCDARRNGGSHRRTWPTRCPSRCCRNVRISRSCGIKERRHPCARQISGSKALGSASVALRPCSCTVTCVGLRNTGNRHHTLKTKRQSTGRRNRSICRNSGTRPFARLLGSPAPEFN